MSYTTEEIKLINKTTTKFYSEVAESFSETRQHEWEGWKNCLQFFHNGDSVLDLGCGNRRFSKFLEENDLNVKVDNYDNFSWDEKVKEADIIDLLLNNTLNLNSYDVAVCFGVMHHIPTSELREKLLAELCKSEIAIVSFWQFEKDERIFKKAKETTKLAQEKLGLQNLEDYDFFLGWQDREDVFRFCHNFTDQEINTIKNNFKTIEEYSADKCNKYLIISK